MCTHISLVHLYMLMHGQWVRWIIHQLILLCKSSTNSMWKKSVTQLSTALNSTIQVRIWLLHQCTDGKTDETLPSRVRGIWSKSMLVVYGADAQRLKILIVRDVVSGFHWKQPNNTTNENLLMISNILWQRNKATSSAWKSIRRHLPHLRLRRPSRSVRTPP